MEKDDKAHPSQEELASLVHGLTETHEARRLERHLATCPTCYAAYAEAVRVELDRLGGRDEPLSPEAREIAARVPLTSGELGPTASSREIQAGRTWRPIAVATVSLAAVAVVFATWITWRSPRSQEHSGRILVAVRESSARGMVLPGGEAWADRAVPDYRGPVSSESPNDSLSEAAIRSLTEGGSSEQAVWALSGYVAQGRLRIARTFVLSARRRFTDDVNLEILDGVISYRDGDLARAESVLRGVVTVHPDNMLARLDLGMLLAEQGRAEAKEMLDRVIKDAPGSPLGNRAQRVLEKLPG